jgi:hypothetical protein
VGYSRREALEQRRRNWRIALGTIILITLPFYCAGIFLWGTAPQRATTPTPLPPTTQGPQVVTATPLLPSPTPLGGFIPSITPLPITPLFPTQPGFPTPIQPTIFIPTLAPTVTRFLSPTPFIQPTNPPPPTPIPQPTAIPAITNTPLPFDNVGP